MVKQTGQNENKWSKNGQNEIRMVKKLVKMKLKWSNKLVKMKLKWSNKLVKSRF
jgi:competence protein ComGF